MVNDFKKLLKKVSSKDRYFFAFVIIALFLTIPITVFAVLNSRDTRTFALHRDCFDITGDYRVTNADVDKILNHIVTGGGYVGLYDLDHSNTVDAIDAFHMQSHIGETCRPTIIFNLSPTSINKGGSASLIWSVNYATSVTINQGIGSVNAIGTRSVSPNSTTTYTLEAANPIHKVQASRTLTVNLPTPPPPSPPPPPDPSDPPPSDDGGTSPGTGSPSPGSPGSGSSPGPGSNTSGPGQVVVTDPSVLNAINLRINAPFLIGEQPLPVVVDGNREEILINGGSKTYPVNLVNRRLLLNRRYNVLVGGNGVLTKRFNITPKSSIVNLNVGRLVFGDMTGDNKIDSGDKGAFLESLINQTLVGDVNKDGVTNSLDWAIILSNFK